MSGIEWTDATWNPIRGCARVSEGCRNCYAEEAAAGVNAKLGAKSPYVGLVRLETARQIQVNLATGNPTGKVRDRMRARWTGAVAFDPEVLAEPLRRKKPTTYFVNSMSDLFHVGFNDEQIAAVFGVMAACPQHRFILLTKRAKRMREWFEFVGSTAYTSFGDGRGQMTAEGCRDEALKALQLPAEYSDRPTWSRGLLGYDERWPLPNVILGVSVENRAALSRIDDLRACPAAVRVISAEPLLEDLGEFDLSGIGWLIAGCESGRNARPCEVDWLRSLRDQCRAAGVPYFLKQAKLGDGITWSTGGSRKPGGIIGLPYLDGVQHAEVPEVLR